MAGGPPAISGVGLVDLRKAKVQKSTPRTLVRDDYWTLASFAT